MVGLKGMVWTVILGVALLWAGAGLGESRREGAPLFGFALEGYPISESQVRSVLCETGIAPGIVLFYLQWRHPDGREPQLGPSLEAIASMGAVPCITWEPMAIAGGKEVMIDHRVVASGGWDGYLADVAATIRAFGNPVLIRFAHEMNLKRYHWGTEEAGYGPDSPEIYRRLFRYVVAFFRKAGVRNALWVFCPNAESLPNRTMDPQAGWNTIASYYPGDDWVDVIGVDGYNWGDTQHVEKHGWKSSWRSFDNLFEQPVRELRALSTEKPLLIFETACAASGGDKGAWIREALQRAQAWNIQGIVWFQVNKEIDWRLQSGITAQDLAWLRSTLSPSHQWIRRLAHRTSK